MALGLDCDAERKERRLQERNQIVAARFLGPWLCGPRIGIDIPELLVDVSVFPRDAVREIPQMRDKAGVKIGNRRGRPIGYRRHCFRPIRPVILCVPPTLPLISKREKNMRLIRGELRVSLKPLERLR
jgi:hypothetical protein